MHVCLDEVMALLLILPFTRNILLRIHTWWHRVYCPHETRSQSNPKQEP